MPVQAVCCICSARQGRAGGFHEGYKHREKVHLKQVFAAAGRSSKTLPCSVPVARLGWKSRPDVVGFRRAHACGTSGRPSFELGREPGMPPGQMTTIHPPHAIPHMFSPLPRRRDSESAQNDHRFAIKFFTNALLPMCSRLESGLREKIARFVDNAAWSALPAPDQAMHTAGSCTACDLLRRSLVLQLKDTALMEVGTYGAKRKHPKGSAGLAVCVCAAGQKCYNYTVPECTVGPASV